MDRDCNEPDITYEELFKRIAYVCPAIEIVDSAIVDWRIALYDTVADNASSGVYVLGDDFHRPGDVDLKHCGMIMEKNGDMASVGVGAACLGDPILAALWLARKMASLGRPLLEGDTVLTGALGPMTDVEAGDSINVEIGGFKPVRAYFV